MVTIWLVIITITFLLCIKRTSYACCCLLVTRILIPECVRLTPLVDVSLNTAIIAVLIFGLIRDIIVNNLFKEVFIKNRYVRCLLLFMIIWILVMPFSSYMDFEDQRGVWFQFLITDIVPAIIFLVSIRTKEDLLLILKSLLIICFVNTLYGVLTIIMGANPYVFIINRIYSQRDFERDLFDATLSVRGNIPTTSSTFQHSNGWGYFLPITFVLFFYINTLRTKYFNHNILLIIQVLLSICVLLSGKRSALISYASFWILYFILASSKQKETIIKWSVIGISIGLVLLIFVPQLSKISTLLETSIFFWDDKGLAKTDVGGSTWDLRVDQLFYPWTIISDNLLLGNGFGWCNVYIKKFELHPILYGFETILSTAVLEGGVLGCLLWSLLFIKSYKYSIISSNLRMWPLLFTFTQVVIAVATGFSYFIFYGIYIVVFSKLFLLNENINRYSHV